MKKQNLVVISLFYVLSGSFSVLGMAVPLAIMPAAAAASEPAESHSQALFHMRSSIAVEDIDATHAGGEIRFESPFFSDRDVVEALSNAARRGVDVSVHISSRSGANIHKMLQAGVKVKVIGGLHAKRCMIIQRPLRKRKVGDILKNIENGAEPETRVAVGSDNFTFCSRFNKEMMVVTRDDLAFYEAHRELFMTPPSGGKAKRRRVVVDTPEKPMPVGSRDVFMNASKALRLMKLAESDAPGDSIDIASMTFDNEDIVEAIERVYTVRKKNRPKFRLILDRTALRHKDLLDRIKRAGGSDVSIYIYNEDASKRTSGRYVQLQHTKTITRSCGDDRLVIVSTGNLTDHSDSDFNVDAYYPGDVRLFDDIRVYNDSLVTECALYTG